MTTTKRARCLVGRNILGNRKFMVKEQIEKRGYVIITGGTSGIGLAAAQCLQAIGYQSILLGRDKIRGLEAVKKVIGSTYLFCDVTDTLSIKKAINEASQLGNITGVVVAAGQYKEGLIENITDEDMEALFKVNTFGVIATIRESVPYLRHLGGSIVVVSSDAAVQGNIQGSLYGATKGAINAFVKSAALELAVDNIRVNSVCLGDIKTPLLEKQFKVYGGNEEETASIYPMMRIGKPEEAGEVIAFLISGKASFMTGSIVMVDGGLTSW